MGGAALHQGMVAEMKTGEGKTLAATLPAYLNALTGKGVHIVTVNDYLAKYQSELMGRVFRFLGMDTGCILAGQPQDERRKQYAGRHHLRDEQRVRLRLPAGTTWSCVRRTWSTRGPLRHHRRVRLDPHRRGQDPAPHLRSRLGGQQPLVRRVHGLVKTLVKDVDYEVDEKRRTVGILEPGIDKVERALGIDNLYSAQNTPLIAFLNNAIKAKELFAA